MSAGPQAAAPRERLRRLRLFASLDDAALDQVGAVARVVRVPRKATLFAEGAPYRGMYAVLEGLVVVYKLSSEGRMLILEVCRPGDTLAEVPLFETGDAGYPAHARATRDSDLLFLPAAAAAQLLRRHPEVAFELLRDFASRLKDLTLRLEGVTLREVTSRLARYLLREVEADGLGGVDRPELVLPLAKGSIASYLGTAHETLSRTFARLVRERIVEVDGPKVRILDKRGLERLS